MGKQISFINYKIQRSKYSILNLIDSDLAFRQLNILTCKTSVERKYLYQKL